MHLRPQRGLQQGQGLQRLAKIVTGRSQEARFGLISLTRGLQGSPQSRLIIQEIGNVTPPLGKQCRKHQRAERLDQDAELREQDAFGNRKVRIAKSPNSERCRPDDRKGEDKYRYGCEYRAATSSDPKKQRKRRSDRYFDDPRLTWQASDDYTQSNHNGQSQRAFEQFATGWRDA